MADDDSDSEPGKWGAIIVGIIMAVPISAILANQAPAALLALIVVGFLAWAGVRSGVLAKDEADGEATADVDPLTTLQERYARGELTEAEFERRLDRILESDELVREAGGAERERRGTVREQDREPAVERE